jgi:hypothetical protein
MRKFLLKGKRSAEESFRRWSGIARYIINLFSALSKNAGEYTVPRLHSGIT